MAKIFFSLTLFHIISFIHTYLIGIDLGSEYFKVTIKY